MDRVVSQLLAEIDGMDSSGCSDVFVIGATNRPDLLEPALLRPGRFDRLLYLGICSDKAAQLKVVDALTRKFRLSRDVDLAAVVAACPLTFTGADFYALCSSALSTAVVRLTSELEQLAQEASVGGGDVTVDSLIARLSDDDVTPVVSQQDFLAALRSTVPSVSQDEVRSYEQLRAKFCKTR